MTTSTRQARRSLLLAPETVEKVRGLVAENLTRKDAAARLGYSYSRTYEIAKRLGLSFRKEGRLGMAYNVRVLKNKPRSSAPVGTSGYDINPLQMDPLDLRAHYTGVKRSLSRWG